MKKLDLVATGGTFDYIHIGHLKLLSVAFNIGKHVIIGLTSDDFVKKFKCNSNIKNNYEIRYQNLKRKILEDFDSIDYNIIKLEDEFGPVISSADIEAIVVSEETLVKVEEINKIRINKHLTPLGVIIVEIAKSEDGKPISSTRIRNGEIDSKGNILRKPL
ncbi:MAG: phosphopantetheine adenylyltransferase [Nitrososphaeraceae archaeon]